MFKSLFISLNKTIGIFSLNYSKKILESIISSSIDSSKIFFLFSDDIEKFSIERGRSNEYILSLCLLKDYVNERF